MSSDRCTQGVMDVTTKERLRYGIEDAVARALEAGWSKDEVRSEFEYQIDNFEGSDADE
jgi:hypothetical protein